MYPTVSHKQVTVLIGFDLFAAFDTVTRARAVHYVERLQSEFGITGTPLTWFQSYLEGRTQFVKLGLHQSPVVELKVGVPQGFVLGLLFFASYCSPAGDITDHSVYYFITTNTPMTRSSTSP